MYPPPPSDSKLNESCPPSGYPLCAGIDTLCLFIPYSPTWRVPGAEGSLRKRDGNLLLRGENFFAITRKIGRGSYQRFFWKITIQANQIFRHQVRLITSSTLRFVLDSVLNAMGAPSNIRKALYDKKNPWRIKFSRVDIAHDYMENGVLFFTKAELSDIKAKGRTFHFYSVEARRKEAEDYRLMREHQYRENAFIAKNLEGEIEGNDTVPCRFAVGLHNDFKTFISDYQSLYGYTPSRTIYVRNKAQKTVQCRYDKRAKFLSEGASQRFTILPRSRIEDRFYSARACERAHIRTYEDLLVFLRRVERGQKSERYFWANFQRHKKKQGRIDRAIICPATGKYRRANTAQPIIINPFPFSFSSPFSQNLVFISFPMRLYRSPASPYNSLSSGKMEFAPTRGPPQSLGSNIIRSFRHAAVKGVLLVFCLPSRIITSLTGRQGSKFLGAALLSLYLFPLTPQSISSP